MRRPQFRDHQRRPLNYLTLSRRLRPATWPDWLPWAAVWRPGSAPYAPSGPRGQVGWSSPEVRRSNPPLAAWRARMVGAVDRGQLVSTRIMDELETDRRFEQAGDIFLLISARDAEQRLELHAWIVRHGRAKKPLSCSMGFGMHIAPLQPS